MNFYEVFVKLMSHGREVGRTCVQLQANSPFMAAVKAKEREFKSARDLLGKLKKVSGF